MQRILKKHWISANSTDSTVKKDKEMKIVRNVLLSTVAAASVLSMGGEIVPVTDKMPA